MTPLRIDPSSRMPVPEDPETSARVESALPELAQLRRTLEARPKRYVELTARTNFSFLSGEEAALLRDMVLTINTFFGWDFNSCEALRGPDGVLHPIDFANACPDSQVTSLHYHFPWLVKANVRWSIFCAVTGRKMRQNLDWGPYYEVADRDDLSYREKLAAYGRIARERLDSDRFGEFCAEHLGHLDEVAWEFFGGDVARDAVHQKVKALYPAHEVEQFTNHFYGLIQFWRKTERDRLGAATEPAATA